jgi:hypothetical protein
MGDLVFLEPNCIKAVPFTTSDLIAEEPQNTNGMKRVYVLESFNGLVKIGVSAEFERRKRTLETQSGFNMKTHFHTDWVSNYSQIEKASHEFFKTRHVLGEWFNISFDEAVEFVKRVHAEIGESIPFEPPTQEQLDEFFNKSSMNILNIDEMEVLRQEDPAIYDYFIAMGYEMVYHSGVFRVIGEDFDLPFETFALLTTGFIKHDSNAL